MDAPSLSATLEGLRRFSHAARQGGTPPGRRCPIPLPTPRKKVPAGLDGAERVKDLRSRCKKRMEKLAEGFVDESADLLDDLRAVQPAVRALFALVRDFEEAYAAEKRRRGVLDFSDLEHRTVELLVGPDGPPSWPDSSRAVRRDHGGRISGHKRGAERHLLRPLRAGKTSSWWGM